MGIQDYFKKLEEDIDEDYKESSLSLKILKHYSPLALVAGAAITAITAPVLYLILEFGQYSDNCKFEAKVKEEVRQELIQFKEEYKNACLEELCIAKKPLDIGWERLNERKEELDKKDSELFIKQVEIDSKTRMLDFDTRHMESDKKWLESSEQRMQSKDKLLTSILDTREGILDVKEKMLDEAEQKLAGLFLCNVKNSLPFSQALDLNGNYILDPVDTEISKRFLGGMPVLSGEYAEAVRYICSPAVIKNLERYGINTQVICVNETTLVMPKDVGIGRVIENVPPELLQDFVAKPGGNKGIEEILCNKRASSCSPVFFSTPGKYCGSGFVLGDNYLVTAYHVAANIEVGSHVQFEDGKKIELSKESIVAYSEEHDIAILKCDFKGYEPVFLQESLAPESIITMSRSQYSANSEKGKTINGVMRRIERVCFDSLAFKPDETPKINGTDRYLASLDGYPGDSGSAVLNQDGEVVGIAVGCYNGCAEAANIVRVKYLKKLLGFYMAKTE